MTDQAAIDRIRGIVVSKPAQFWEPVAKQELHSYRQEDGVWLSLASGEKESEVWMGWHASTAAIEVTLEAVSRDV